MAEARPSVSPERVKRWTCCTWCNRVCHEEEVGYPKRNDKARRETARANVYTPQGDTGLTRGGSRSGKRRGEHPAGRKEGSKARPNKEKVD